MGVKASSSRVWREAPCDNDAVDALVAPTGLPRPLLHVLVSRGFRTAQDIDLHLNPRLSALSDPFALPNMMKAVSRIWRAIDQGERIVIYGDYDVDGISSTALMIKVLSLLGADAHPFLPHRVDEGYGLGVDALKRCMENEKPGLIVTVDCGTGSVEAVKMAKKAGIDVIVTDHLEPSGPLAPAVALVNPKLGKDENARMLAGVGVAFKLCHALVKQGRNDNRQNAADCDLLPFLDLVALGTVTDIVPLLGENRTLARHGLAQLNKTQHIGLLALRDVAGITGSIDAYEVGFRIGPRLNAAGRMGDALNALTLLLTRDPAEARTLAQQLDASNRERQGIEAAILRDAVEELDVVMAKTPRHGLVVAHKDWHPGVIGIVASRLCARYNRPVIVVALDGQGGGRGSGRSIEGFNIVEGLGACSELFDKFGGHAMAAGLEIAEDRMALFRQRFDEIAEAKLRGSDLRPVQRIDAWVELAGMDEDLMKVLDSMRPFGFGQPTPVWAVKQVRLASPPRVVGQMHLKMTLISGGTRREAIGFGMAGRPLPEGPFDVAFHLRRDTFRGATQLVLNVQDIRAS